MHDNTIPHETAMIRRMRRLAWLTTALAFAPLMGLLLVGLCEAILPPKGHNPFLASDRPWRGLLMVLAITAPAHVPYIVILCVTAWGLFRHREWARIAALVLAPLAAILSLFAGGESFASFSSWLTREGSDSSRLAGAVFLSPIAVLSAAYCVLALIVFWGRDVSTSSIPPTPGSKHPDH